MRAIEQGLFNRIRSVTFAGCEWYACGNIELLNLPEIVPFRGSRSILSGTPEWQAMINRAARLGPASAGVSTFVGTLEKKCAHEIALAGGNLIILSPRGFPPAGNGSGYDTPQGEPTRWHPPRSHEPFFAKGKILYLSQWAGTFHKLSNDEFFRRCHAMWYSLEGGMGGL